MLKAIHTGMGFVELIPSLLATTRYNMIVFP